MKYTKDFILSDISDLGFEIKLTNSFLAKHTLEEAVGALKQSSFIIDAASKEAISMAARVYKLQSDKGSRSHGHVTSFICEYLNAPDKGLSFLIKLANEQ